MTKKSISAPMVFRTTTGNPAYLDPGQHQMTMKQSCSLAFERCFHFDLILILSKVSSTTHKIIEASGLQQGPIVGILRGNYQVITA